MQQRCFLTLEVLDERIVPSAGAMASIYHGALAEHPAIHAHARAHVPKAHEVVHPKAVHLARMHHKHHNRIVPAVQISSGLASAPAVASPVTVLSTTGIEQAQGPTVAALPIATSMGSTPIATTVGSTTSTPKVPVPNPAATSNPADIQNGPLAKAGQDLITIYEEFVLQGGSATFTSTEAGLIRIQGTSVGVDVHSTGGNFGSLVSAMTGLGMQVQAKDATFGVVEGLLPIGQLVAAAQDSQTLSLTPIYIRIPQML
jgi:hypothetical protein